MTSLLDARAELATALTTAGVAAGAAALQVEPPAALIFGAGIDLADRGHVARGQVPARFRVTVLGGLYDDGDVPGSELMDALALTLAAIREADGWALVETRADYVARVAGGNYLAADVIASRMIDL